MSAAAQTLKGFIEEIEASRDRQQSETKHQRDIFSRAKDKGFDTRAMRKVLQRRAMDPATREELDHLVDTYEAAVGAKRMAAEALSAGKTVREAAEASGLSVGSVASIRKHVQYTQQIEHDPETGEVIEDAASHEDASNGVHNAPSPQPDTDGEVGAGTNSETAIAESPGSGEVRAVNEAASGQPAADSSCSPVRKASDSTEPVVPTGNEGRAGERDPIEDDLTLPAFLDRRRQHETHVRIFRNASARGSELRRMPGRCVHGLWRIPDAGVGSLMRASPRVSPHVPQVDYLCREGAGGGGRAATLPAPTAPNSRQRSNDIRIATALSPRLACAPGLSSPGAVSGSSWLSRATRAMTSRNNCAPGSATFTCGGAGGVLLNFFTSRSELGGYATRDGADAFHGFHHGDADDQGVGKISQREAYD